jgi:gamma-polyglutamate biosynthesis protein CapC
MTDLLPLSVGIGLFVGLSFTELFGLASGGLIVPGYLALYMTEPLTVALTLGGGLLTYGVVRALSTFLIVYGRRRTALMILIGYLVSMLVRGWTQGDDSGFAVIGFIIPGLIGIWMDREGVFETICSLLVSSSVVRLILVLGVGSELT